MKINCRLKAAGGVFRKNLCVYPKAIDAGRIAGNDFVDKLEYNCNVTPAMAQAVFSGMTTELLKNLMLGHSVEIPGLGVFWVDVKGKVKERKNGAKYIDNSKVRISFTPKTELNRRLNEVTLDVVSDSVAESVSMTADEVNAVVDRLLAKRPWLTGRQFAEETGASLLYSHKILNGLVDKKMLTKEREGALYVYSRPVE